MAKVWIQPLFNGEATVAPREHNVRTVRGLMRVINGNRCGDGWGTRVTLSTAAIVMLGAWQRMGQWWVGLPGRDPFPVDKQK